MVPIQAKLIDRSLLDEEEVWTLIVILTSHRFRCSNLDRLFK